MHVSISGGEFQRRNATFSLGYSRKAQHTGIDAYIEPSLHAIYRGGIGYAAQEVSSAHLVPIRNCMQKTGEEVYHDGQAAVSKPHAEPKIFIAAALNKGV